MVIDLRRIIYWLKQPSTIKAIGGIAGFLGFAYTQADLEKWTAAVVGFSVLVNGVYDNIPRAKALTLDELCCQLKKLTPEKRTELMTIYKSKIKA